jgi:hypothetical protein
MKKLTTNLAILSLLCLLNIGTFAHDKDLKEHVQISQKVLVNGTTVKPGYYLVKYNSDTGMMSLVKGNKVVATAKATVKVNSDDFDRDAILTRSTSMGEVLTAVRLGGQREELDLVDVIAEVIQDDDFTLEMCW